MVVWAIDRPRSAIISTKSRKLSLKRRYHLTHKTMTSRSKWRPSNSSSKPRNPAIALPLTHQKAGRIGKPANCTRALPRSTRASGRRDAAAMVGPGHPAHDTGAAGALLAGDHLGARIDAEIQHRRPPPSRRLVQQAPTNLQ